MDIQHRQFLDKAALGAESGAHVYPTMAACEAALESGFGTSMLAIAYSNLFGMKQHQHPVYGTVGIPTKEFVNGVWTTVQAEWVKYPDWAACFTDRMNTLIRMAPHYPHYDAALRAKTAEDYVDYASMSWSTDPERGQKVVAIHNEYLEDMEARP